MSSNASTERAPVVASRLGPIAGVRHRGNFAYFGIPYAAPPVGELRFAAPQRPEPWQAPFAANAYGPTAPQPQQAFTIIPEPQIPGRNCLNLNVFTPDPTGGGLPVLVWIHGGGFFAGCSASPWLDGTSFARRGVVLVSLNYRLGVDGFAVLEDAVDNRGVLDWIAALEWVQENISAFGGDPTNVTIAGQSAGGAACATLLAVPRAKGLFGRAIMMSGATGIATTRDANEGFTAALAARFGVEPTRNGIGSIPLDRLLPDVLKQGVTTGTTDPLAAATTFGAGGLSLQPVPDGDLYPVDLRQAIRVDGSGDEVDVLVGATFSEMEFEFFKFEDRVSDALLASTAGELGLFGLTQLAFAEYKEVHGDMSPARLLGHLATDRAFRVPAVRVAESRASRNVDTFHYDFRWRAPSCDLPGYGSGHCLDIPFAFDALDAEGVETIAGSHPPQELADIMHRAWVSFVSDGNPGWPVYELDRRETMIFDSVSRVESDPLQLERRIWPDSV